jgi:GTP-binding protein
MAYIMLPVVAIVGKPNVGKSTLFNRIVGRRIAVTSPVPGVTRDRNYSSTDWSGVHFILVDTGGFVPYPDEPISKGVKRQVELALAEADLIVWLLSYESITGMDREIADTLRKVRKPIVLAVNKVDSSKREGGSPEVYSLGYGEAIEISGLHGRGVGDLLDEVIQRFPPAPEPEDADDLKLAVVGRPNVGKSSLINGLLGEERVLVADTPGTTRDSIDTGIEYDGRKLVMIDTAGLRRKAKVKGDVEYYTVLRSIRSVERCDVAIVMLDAVDGVTRQDKRVISLPMDFGKGIVVVVNKIDLVEKEETLDRVMDSLNFLDNYPLIPTSCLTGEGMFDVLKFAILVSDDRRRRIEKAALSDFLASIVKKYPPPFKGKRRLIISRIAQVRVSPPTFLLRVNRKELMTENYLRYVRNSLRKEFRFIGTPIRVETTERRSRASR